MMSLNVFFKYKKNYMLSFIIIDSEQMGINSRTCMVKKFFILSQNRVSFIVHSFSACYNFYICSQSDSKITSVIFINVTHYKLKC